MKFRAWIFCLFCAAFLPIKIIEALFLPSSSGLISRRALFDHVSLLTAASITTTTTITTASSSSSDIIITLAQPGTKLGLELTDVLIGTPPRSVAAIKRVVAVNGNNKLLQAGMILPEFENAATVQQLLQSGPYPLKLAFRSLAAGGDALSDVGTPLVTSADALQLAQKTSSSSNTANNSNKNNAVAFEITQLRSKQDCRIRSRRNDLLEINYTARYGSPSGPVYDSSLQRGTGQPYQMVLGSGDMIPGVDLGLYEMCPGDVRLLQIPPAVGYGPRARSLYRIPDDQAVLYWQVELVSVNSVREGNDISREELEERVPYSLR